MHCGNRATDRGECCEAAAAIENRDRRFSPLFPKPIPTAKGHGPRDNGSRGVALSLTFTGWGLWEVLMKLKAVALALCFAAAGALVVPDRVQARTFGGGFRGFHGGFGGGGFRGAGIGWRGAGIGWRGVGWRGAAIGWRGGGWGWGGLGLGLGLAAATSPWWYGSYGYSCPYYTYGYGCPSFTYGYGYPGYGWSGSYGWSGYRFAARPFVGRRVFASRPFVGRRVFASVHGVRRSWR